MRQILMNTAVFALVLFSLLMAAGACALEGGPGRAERSRAIWIIPTIQYRNIGDVAHPFGIMRLVRREIPEAKILIRGLSSGHEEIRDMMARHFPDVGAGWGDHFEEADLLTTSSAPIMIGLDKMREWVRRTDKPFGIYGVSTHGVTAEQAELLSRASFLYFRDTKSLRKVLDDDDEVNCPEIGFVPDAVFAFDLLNEEKALAFLKEKGLKERQYICVIPRLRHSPPGLRLERGPYGQYTDRKKSAMDYNRQFMEKDHARLREVIVTWVRRTGKKVLLCPEMTYALDIMEPLLYDPLPEDVKPSVVIRNTYWMPDEAGSVYKRAFALVALDCHSAIIASVHETPVLVPHQGNAKYQMWQDIGLGDWSWHIDQVTGEYIAEKLMEIHTDYPAAKEKMREAMNYVRARHRETMNHIRGLLDLPPN